MNCGKINGKNIQALGLVPATKKPSLKKEKKLFDVMLVEFMSFGLEL